MAETPIPETVSAAQRTVDAAWAAVEKHRKTVDAARRTEAAAAGAETLRPWTEAEDAEYAQLHQAAVAAAEARAAALIEAGIVSTYDNEVAIRGAARETLAAEPEA
ncbi:hypothetical protein ACWERV_16900 [Streptomyces sp. NPDC004031]